MKVYLLECIKNYYMKETKDLCFKKDRCYTFISLGGDDNRLFTFDEDNDCHYLNLDELLNEKYFKVLEKKDLKEIEDINRKLLNG